MRETFPEKVYPWFALKSVPGVGNILYKRLIERFSLPESVFNAAVRELKAVEGVSAGLAETIKKHKPDDAVRREVDLAVEKGYRIATYADEDYPYLLRQIPDPPPYVYIAGVLTSRSLNIAVVGTRNPTSYGLSMAKRLSGHLVTLGYAVVSGMARGIDTAAHYGAIEKNGRTFAVLGSGFNRIYPKENRPLFQKIKENGAVISEFALDAGPEPHHFPIRNRVISGMSLGTLVVEAAKKSGSLITARLAAEQNREVFAVPGSIKSFKSIGTHNLIKQGAKLVEHARDIVEELPPQFRKEMATKLEDVSSDAYNRKLSDGDDRLGPDERKVAACLEHYPIHIDELVRKTSMPPGKLSGILLKLELEGKIEQLPGKNFAIKG